MEERLFDRYEIRRELGRGGFGKVYLAHDHHLNKAVAVKKMPPGKNFEKEALILKELKHEGLPTVYDYRCTADAVYLIMEYVDGITLRQLLDKKGKLPREEALFVTMELTKILKYLHEQSPQIIYRDLKPSNIMLLPEGGVRLVDLGAAFIGDHSPDEERDQYATPGYSAPELFRGARADASSDIYSIGAVLHEMLTGERGQDGDYKRKLLRQYDPTFPKGLQMILARCLSGDASGRYRNIGDLEKDLLHYSGLDKSAHFLKGIRILTVLSSYLTAFVTFYYAWQKGTGYRIPLLVLCCAFLLTLCLYRKDPGKACLYKAEEDIFLTDKKVIMMLSLSFFLLGAAGISLWKEESASFAGAEPAGTAESLWVELKDVSERKLLLKTGSFYDVTDKVRFEIPAEDLPADDMKIRIMAEDPGGNTFVSRTFLVHYSRPEETVRTER